MNDQTDMTEARAALDRVVDPKSGLGLVAAELVKGLVVAQGRAGFMLEAPAADIALYAPVRDAAQAALAALPGIERVHVALTSETAPAASTPRRAALSREAVDQDRKRAPVPTSRPDHVRRVIVVASGKGGVGKSTVSANLACALTARGLRVGLLDADVYGPSVPLMMGVQEAPRHEDGKLQPLDAWGVKVMSVGFLVGADQALVWRGPMASQALTQMLTQTAWGTEAEPMDVLVVDLPPGTGDVQLTLGQKTLIDGAVLVSTPQEAALIDARRAWAMFSKTGVTVLGLVENMSGPVFGEGGARREAERLGVPLLAQIPLDAAVRLGGDAGRPVAIAEPTSDAALAFSKLAEAVA